MQHPQVGELHLRREKLPIVAADGQQLVIYHAEPGTDSARALALLGSIAVTDARDSALADEDATPLNRPIDVEQGGTSRLVRPPVHGESIGP